MKLISQTDALGRLTNIWEVRSPDAASGTVSVSFPNHPEITAGYQTDYIYDSLGNLRKVIQGAQTRWFAYDSLSRLIRVKNPEQITNSSLPPHTDPVTGGSGWCMAYSYDANGNMVSKIDARNITTTYGYDALNRNTTVSYSDSTPGVTRIYDTATLGKGRLQKAETAGSTGSRVTINAYDAMGRPKSQSQQFFYLGAWGTSYTTEQTYDLAGALTTMTYPSLRTVNYSYDSAGRLSGFSGALGGSSRNYADTIGYNAAGQMLNERFGTNTSLYHNLHYNNRHQLVSIRVGDNSTNTMDWSRGAIDFFYGATAVASGNPFANDTDNNGNLRRQITHVPLAGGGYVIPQQDDYTYDALNRISSFTETQRDSGGQWINAASQNYSYDRSGNRRITSATGGVNNYNPTYDLGSNRIVGLGYDQAGNITGDVLTGGTMTYNAENRLLTATNGGGGNYTYDPEGRRVRRTAGGQETWHIYGMGGELLAEYAANGSPNAPKKEYGYRGGQLLIIAESGSGGGTSFVKPGSQSKSDLIGKIGAGAGGVTNRIFSTDEPFINNGYGSFIAGSSDSDNDGTPVRGGPRTTAEEYGDAPSANGVSGELLAQRPAGAQPSAPQEEYRNRSGLSIVTAQGNGVVTVNPTAFQTPDSGQGGAGVSSQINTGHGSTITGSSTFAPGGFGGRSDFDARSARWSAFQSVSGAIVSVRLKFDWSVSGSASAGAAEDGGSASSGWDFKIDYSLNGGSGWTNRVIRSLSVGGNDSQNLNTSGSEDILLSPGQNITQVQVRDYMNTGAAAQGGQEIASSAIATITTSISNIRIEVELDTTPPAISSVAAVGITSSGATITWTTNEDSDSQVEYGTSQNYGQSTTLNPVRMTAHSQGLSGLTAGTEYHYRVKSKDAAGNLALSGDFTFTTAQQSGSVEIKWLVTDHLGSTRMVIDQTGSLAGIKRHDFAPFGEELVAGAMIRSASNGYSGDSVRQKFGSKERDIETGLDYFINRYYSSVQGRFTSVDPIFFQKDMMVDPQRYNLYVYIRNNPLRFVDPNGEAIELPADDEEKRKKILAALREIVGEEAGTYLYENKITDKDGKTRYFVGINGGPSGKRADFFAKNKVSSQIGRIIDDTRIASVNLVGPGTKYTAKSPDGRKETRVVGPIQPNSGDSPGLTDPYTGNITMLDPKYAYGKLPGSVMSNGVDNDPGFSTALGHEFGHIQFAWGHSMGSSNDSAVGLENEVRLLKDPSGPTRARHNPGDPDVGSPVKGGAVIKCPGCVIK